MHTSSVHNGIEASPLQQWNRSKFVKTDQNERQTYSHKNTPDDDNFAIKASGNLPTKDNGYSNFFCTHDGLQRRSKYSCLSITKAMRQPMTMTNSLLAVEDVYKRQLQNTVNNFDNYQP